MEILKIDTGRFWYTLTLSLVGLLDSVNRLGVVASPIWDLISKTTLLILMKQRRSTPLAINFLIRLKKKKKRWAQT